MNLNIQKYITTHMDTIVGWVSEYSLKVIAAILIFLIGKWLVGKISKLLAAVLEKNKVDVTLVGFLSNITYYALMIVVLIAVAGQLGINTTSFLTIVGAAGLAVVRRDGDLFERHACGRLIRCTPADTVGAGSLCAGRMERALAAGRDRWWFLVYKWLYLPGNYDRDSPFQGQSRCG